MRTVLTWLVEALASWLTGWLVKRRAAAAEQKSANTRVEAEAHSAVIGDQAAAAVEKARAESDDQVDKVRADAGLPDGLRKQSADVQSAIDAANRELPGA